MPARLMFNGRAKRLIFLTPQYFVIFLFFGIQLSILPSLLAHRSTTMFSHSPEYEARLARPFVPPSITLKQIHAAVPKHLLQKSTLRSAGYILRDVALCICLFTFAAFINTFATTGFYGAVPVTASWQIAWLRTALWLTYWWWQGLVFTSFFCIAHELGHGALFHSWYANNVAGFLLDTASALLSFNTRSRLISSTLQFILLPYFAWKLASQKAVGSMERDENYVPHLRSDFKLPPQERARTADYVEVFEETPIMTLFRMVVMQSCGWWLYLSTNVMGSKKYPEGTNHFSPYSPLFKKEQRHAIIISDIGIVMCTFLHHSDPSIPHYRGKEWTYLRGILATVDRPLLGWIGRFFFHNVSHDHIAHHFFSSVPFYNQPQVTEAIKTVLGDEYNYDSTNSFFALYRSFTECVFVEEEDDIVFYKNGQGVAAREVAEGVLVKSKKGLQTTASSMPEGSDSELTEGDLKHDPTAASHPGQSQICDLMSFSDLRSARKSKEARSFVKASDNAGHATPSHHESYNISSPAPDITDVGVAASPRNAMNLPSPGVDTTEPVVNLLVRGIPDTLEVRKSAESGRGLYAKDSFGVGSVLISLRPRVAVLSINNLDNHCSWCSNPAPDRGLKRCTRCRTVYYCDSNHDWPFHKNECDALQQWAAVAPSPDVSVPSDAVRCIGRILWNIQRKGLDSVWASELSTMQSHRASLQPSTFESHTHLAHSVVRYLGATSPEDLAPFGLSSAGDLVDVISRFTTNAFTLTSHTLTPIGVCYSPALALANHSCDPNAVIVFPHYSDDFLTEPNMQLISIKPVASGDQVFISYVDTTLPRDQRHAVLKETYNFVCKCTLCNKRAWIDPRASLYCPNLCGGVCPMPIEEDDLPRCSKCKAIVKNSDVVLDALRIGQEALDKATRVQFTDLTAVSTDPAKAKQLTTNLIPILTRAGLTPASHPLLAMMRVHQEMLLSSLPNSLTQEYLDQTIQTAAKYTSGLSETLPYGHPVRAIALVEFGKLLAVDEPSPPESGSGRPGYFPPSGPARLKMAYETLLRARNELLIGFGKENDGGRVGKELRDTIVRLEKELGVWTEGIRNALEDARAAQMTQK
ncbi:hypothetical protein NM688_g3643 [Phlebia brevispora]|uniref:Uncharacterized protein n=1 Tax=Phlebia brevispora TaxID=194682 RepID=A0ACC1T586_9APHY|nr:hypothetical protein NM688_g3643 [Phlebia brevispora]